MLRPIADAHPDRLPSKTSELEELLAALGGSDASKLGRWRAWRVFFRWCKDSLGVADPMQRVKRPHQKKALPKALTDNQVDRLLAANAQDHRDLAMLSLMLDTGMRVGEIATLTRDHIRINGARCTVLVPRQGKTGEREIPLSEGARQLLMRLPVNGPHLWSAERGYGHPAGSRLQTNGVQHALRRAFQRAAIKGSPHSLRHTFGKLYIRNGGNVFSLKEILGHSSIEMTMVYVHMNKDDLAEQHAKYSPMASRFRSLDHAATGERTAPPAGATS